METTKIGLVRISEQEMKIRIVNFHNKHLDQQRYNNRDNYDSCLIVDFTADVPRDVIAVGNIRLGHKS